MADHAPRLEARHADCTEHPELECPLGNGDGILKVLYGRDGRHLLVISGLEGRITRWDVDPESWKRRACDIAGHNLTRNEWRDFVGDRPYHATCP